MDSIFRKKCPYYLINRVGFYFDADRALEEACQIGNLAKVKIALLLGADIEGVAACPPLILATKENHLEIVKELIEQGADIEAIDLTEYWTDAHHIYGTALISAIIGNHNEIVEYLIEKKANLNRGNPEYDNYTPLMYASSYGNSQAVKLLLDQKANVNARSNLGETALSLAITIDDCLEICQLLIEYGADINTPSGQSNQTPLCQAIFWDSLSILKLLIDSGADLHHKDPYNNCTINNKPHDGSALSMATLYNRKEALKLLNYREHLDANDGGNI